MRRDDFHFHLPETQIAQFPLTERGASRLLFLDGDTGDCRDTTFSALPDFLRPGDLLVFNDTRVIPARLWGQKSTGGRVEILVERVLDEYRCLAHVRASKSLKPGGEIHLGQRRLVVEGRQGELYILESPDLPMMALVESQGEMPLPPYIQRRPGSDDSERYQTVYGRHKGAVAAPTAGLHFDQAMLDRLQAMGVVIAFVTLHVGAGTFQPVRVEELSQHKMHSERVVVDKAVVEKIHQTRQRGGRVVAVGTTTVRSLESAARGGELQPFQGETDIFITPGFQFRVVDLLITNFHLPASTLLMLVSAFAGYEQTLAAYRHAVEAGYRFFSYGDAMLISRRHGSV